VLAQVGVVLGRKAGVAVIGGSARREVRAAEAAGERVEAGFLVAEAEGRGIEEG
jgi:hypothetical protein